MDQNYCNLMETWIKMFKSKVKEPTCPWVCQSICTPIAYIENINPIVLYVLWQNCLEGTCKYAKTIGTTKSNGIDKI